ncbi:MAG: FAD-binding oxidoreductase [Actinobacteria bacterium]|nr:FAD-binding oxidoreductase [Actinomycetota bacterium]
MHGFLNDRIRIELKNIVGEKNIYESGFDKDAYSVDVWSVSRNWVDSGLIKELPNFVVLPENTEQVSKILKLANIYSIPITPRGAGAGGLGGGIPFFGGIVLDIKKLDKIMSLSAKSLNIRVQVGIMQIDLEKYLNSKGYTLNHLPASIYCSTLGGFLSTRGSGVLSSKYGKIEDMVLSLEVVLPTGEIINTLPVPRHSAGPGIENVFLGAEGTLGIITGATLQIYYLPEERYFSSFLFDNLHFALEASREVMVNGLEPSVLRVYDEGDTRDVVKKELGINIESGSYVVISFDGFKDIALAQKRRAEEIFNGYRARDLGAKFGEKWWENRYDPYYPPHTLESKKDLYGVIDTVATHDNIENLYLSMKSELESKFSEWGIIYTAHFSHWYKWGASVYPRFIVKKPPENSHDFMELNNAIWDCAVEVILKNNGVLSEHHGIGFQLSPYMRAQYRDGYKVLESLKKGLDPKNIMNPTIFGFDL